VRASARDRVVVDVDARERIGRRCEDEGGVPERRKYIDLLRDMDMDVNQNW
jgi:hypothetical protein